ncbi:Oidioi.mRNA.OKI2018_I69.PAR.g11802.t2.cds [Oikopleura dioica]|nr:Oidioi.mRNA.OKI2018_I69.PAR.g11802.t2.cds [Oikopleura dioica]
MKPLLQTFHKDFSAENAPVLSLRISVFPGFLVDQFQKAPITKIRTDDHRWKILVDHRRANSEKDPNDDPLEDLNDARERTQNWLFAMDNLSPAALSTLKKELEKRVHSAMVKINETEILNDEEKKFKRELLTMFVEELKESERDMQNAIEGLRRSLTSDFRNPLELKGNSKHRLDFLRGATMHEEQSFNKLKGIEDMMEKYDAQINSIGVFDELLKDVARAADVLEDKIQEHIVDTPLDGRQIEAVMHIRENTNPVVHKEGVEDDDEPEIDSSDVLVDSQNNKYVLSKPKDSTSPLIDHHLVMDLITLLLMSFPMGAVCERLGLPPLFGYIMTGVFLGPSGINNLKSMVQVETIGEFGVFFILFFAGLEFSPEKIRNVWKVAIQGPMMMLGLMVYVGITMGSMILHQIHIKEYAFISACLSLSSTPLVMKFLERKEKERTDSPEAECSQYLMGMLVMQDVQLGLIMALLPSLAEGSSSESSNDIFFNFVKILFQTCFNFFCVMIIFYLFYRFVISAYLKLLQMFSKEVEVLGTTSVIFAMLLTTQWFGISMELGCFLGGFLIALSNSSCSENQVHEIEKSVGGMRDLFSVVFFATIGFHVFPSFVVGELTVLLLLTFVVVGVKFVISVIVLRVLLPPKGQHLRWLLSSGLAQISEFCFVLSSRARRLKIISREVYLLILPRDSKTSHHRC